MNILIIGGSGHVSGTVARTALAGGHAVWTVTRGNRPLPEGATSLIADRQDTDAITKAGLSVPSTSIVEGLRRHVEGLLRD